MVCLLHHGAFGIFLGTFYHIQIVENLPYLPLILAMIAIILLLFVQKDKLEYIEKEQKYITENGNKFDFKEVMLILVLIGISIIVRSIGGGAIKYAWKLKDVLWIGLTYTGFVFLGKAFGGLIADKIGHKKTALIALATACISLILGFNIPAFGFLGIFLFNVPMSITLLQLENCNKNSLAMMVGSNTFFLFIGYLICLLPNTLNNYAVLIGSIVAAIISIYFAFRIYEKHE